MSTSRRSSPGAGQNPRIRIAAARAAKTFGDLAVTLASDYGLTPDEWQSLILDDWLAATAKDKWKHTTCGLSVPRQNGKNAVLEMRELFGMIGLGEHVLHSAHEVKTAQSHYRRFKEFFGSKADDPAARYPELNALVEQVRNVNGQEAIILKKDPAQGLLGGALRVVARSKSSGRGFSADLLVLDEAQELSDDALEALLSTISAGRLGNSQILYTGTPPGPNAAGEVFTRVRANIIEHSPRGVCWHEWSADADSKIDLDDRALWAECNPGLGAGRLQLAIIEAERKTLSDEGFKRERLGMWPANAGARRAIDPATWAATIAAPPEDGIRSFGVAFSADGKRQALAGAVKTGKGPTARFHVNVIDTYTGPTAGGVAAVADWLAERRERTAQINLLGGAGASALADALTSRGVPKRVVHVMTTSEYFTSCALLFEGLREGRITHPDEDPDEALSASVAVCDKQQRRRDGAYGWEATTPDGDETPLEAVSAAVHAAKTTKRRPRGKGGRKAVVM